MKHKKEKTILTILWIVSFILFLLIYYYLTFECINRYYTKGVFFALPMILIGGLNFLYFKDKIKKKTIIFLLIIIISVSIIASFTGLIFIQIEDLLSEVTDINEYKRILKMEKNSNLVYQFPDEISDNIEEVRFFYRPQFLQGAMQMQLEMEMKQQTIKDYVKKYEKQSKIILKANEYKFDDLEEQGIYNLGDKVTNQIIAENYTIYLLQNKSFREDDWNHGYVVFVAVNELENYILFQTEVW